MSPSFSKVPEPKDTHIHIYGQDWGIIIPKEQHENLSCVGRCVHASSVTNVHRPTLRLRHLPLCLVWVFQFNHSDLPSGSKYEITMRASGTTELSHAFYMFLQG